MPAVSFHSHLTDQAGEYISSLFAEKLPAGMLFNNYHHTLSVVNGVNEFLSNLNIKPKDGEALLLAAWFHDSGHVQAYDGHELYSQELAKSFLQKVNYPEELIERILNCIKATEMPQHPDNIWEEIICDADFYHLCQPGYFYIQKMLRKEWELVKSKVYTDEEWNVLNLQFLKEHNYHTHFARLNFEEKKQVNIEKYKQLVFGENK